MMRVNIYYLFTVLILSHSLNFLFAWQYPVKNLRVTSLFGESRIDHFHNGIDFANEQLVYPIEKGEVIFYYEEIPTSDFTGVGNHMIIEHQGGIRSFYYHLADDSLNKGLTFITKRDILANMGNTGKSFGSHLHLTIVDVQSQKVLNPQLVLPKLEDKKKPIIESLFFTIKERPNIFKIKNKTIINYNDKIKLYLIAGDIKSEFSSRNLNPFNAAGLRRLTLVIDEQIFRNYEFEYFIHQEDKLVLNNGMDFNKVYGLSFNYLLGEFYPTKTLHKFYIEIEDWTGNIDVENYSVIFRL